MAKNEQFDYWLHKCYTNVFFCEYFKIHSAHMFMLTALPALNKGNCVHNGSSIGYRYKLHIGNSCAHFPSRYLLFFVWLVYFPSIYIYYWKAIRMNENEFRATSDFEIFHCWKCELFLINQRNLSNRDLLNNPNFYSNSSLLIFWLIMNILEYWNRGMMLPYLK